jgi:hypothetical protein
LEQKKKAEADLAAALHKQGAINERAAALQKREKLLAARLSEEEGRHALTQAMLLDALSRMSALEGALAEAKEKLPTLRLDAPNGTHRIEALDRGEVCRLAGRIGTLTVGSIKGGATLDASRLEARKIIFEHSVNGRSRVILNAPKGAVALTKIDGESTADIQAPGGRVQINEIFGDSRVTIRAREVRFANTINGARTEVNVTLTHPAAALAFNQLLGRSRLTWRKEKPTDPAPRLAPGRVDREARFEKLD